MNGMWAWGAGQDLYCEGPINLCAKHYLVLVHVSIPLQKELHKAHGKTLKSLSASWAQGLKIYRLRFSSGKNRKVIGGFFEKVQSDTN